MNLMFARFAGTALVLSTLALATPAYAFSLSSFYNFFGGGPAAVQARPSQPNPTFAAPQQAANPALASTTGSATSTAMRVTISPKGQAHAQCIRSAENTRNAAIRAAQQTFQISQKNRTASSTANSTAARQIYKAAVKAAQGAFAIAKAGCDKQ